MSTTRLFVYGTLKSGFSNNFRLAGQQFVGKARTRPLYRMLNLGWHPGLIPASGKGVSIEGELWEIDAPTLRKLDEFEGVPKWFDRRVVLLERLDERAEAYFYQGDATDKADAGNVWPPPGYDPPPEPKADA